MSPVVDNTIRLFIIDDHKIVINGIKLVIEQHLDIDLVGFAQNAESAKEALSRLEVDVVLQDIQLPDQDGIELTHYIRKTHPKINIIGLTSHTESSFISELLRAGAKGYLFKDISEVELLQAIRTVFTGKQYLSYEVNQKIINRVLHRKNDRRSFIPKLTRREKEVLTLIVEENTSQEIADKLFLSVSTIEKHRINLGIKLDARNAIGLYKKAIKFGLLE